MAAKKDKPWFRRLADGQLEIFLKAGKHKVRAHGPEDDMYELMAWFEERAGVTIHGEWKRPPQRGPRVIEGQTSLLDLAEVTEEQPDESDEAPDLTGVKPADFGRIRDNCSPYGPTVPEPTPDMGTL